MKRLNEVLSGRGGSYILPFFWLHGESHDVLREEIDKMENCQIREFCVESRPHPDVMGKQWWSDMDMSMDEARKEGCASGFWMMINFPQDMRREALKNSPKRPKYMWQSAIWICAAHKKTALY